MSTIELELAKGTIDVDATFIAEGLGLEAAGVLDSLRRGELDRRLDTLSASRITAWAEVPARACDQLRSLGSHSIRINRD